MSAPEGYTALATLSYSYKGEYSADSTYNKYNTVYFEGSTYVSIQDGNTGHEPSNDGVWWKYVARGFLTEDAAEIEAKDTYGVTDEEPTPAGGLTKKTILQTWLDKVADRIINKLVANDSFQTKLMEFLVNNGTTNLEGFGLDARFGKTLQDQISELNAKRIIASNFADAWAKAPVETTSEALIKEANSDDPDSPAPGSNRWYVQQYKNNDGKYGWQVAWTFNSIIYKRFCHGSSQFSTWYEK